MAKNAAKGKTAKGKTAKPAPAVDAAALGAAADVEVQGAKAAGVSKDTSSIEATGKFEVVEISAGKFRMYNEVGQAVSDVVSRDDMLENGKPALAKLIRDSRRANALRKQREIRTPRGHEAVQ